MAELSGHGLEFERRPATGEARTLHPGRRRPQRERCRAWCRSREASFLGLRASARCREHRHQVVTICNNLTTLGIHLGGSRRTRSRHWKER